MFEHARDLIYFTIVSTFPCLQGPPSQLKSDRSDRGENCSPGPLSERPSLSRLIWVSDDEALTLIASPSQFRNSYVMPHVPPDSPASEEQCGRRSPTLSPTSRSTADLPSQSTSSLISKPPSSGLLSLPPEILLLVARSLGPTAPPKYRSSSLSFCTTCRLPYISNLGRISLVAFGLSHPFFWRLLEGYGSVTGRNEGGWNWLYRCWKWLSDERLRREILGESACNACHEGYKWQGKWPTLHVGAEVVARWELNNSRDWASVLVDDRRYTWVR